MDKKELRKFKKRLEFLTTNELDQDGLVKYADAVAGFSDELDKVIEQFLGIDKPGLCDHKYNDAWVNCKSNIGEFKEWLNKKLTKRKK
jgi:hypothetical protein